MSGHGGFSAIGSGMKVPQPFDLPKVEDIQLGKDKLGALNVEGHKAEVQIDPIADGERADGRVGLRITTTARVDGKTGIEMEALTAASVACLTVYDMCKAVDRGMEIGEIHLLRKEGGRTGLWTRN